MQQTKQRTEQIIIGVDPHKLSATIEVLDRRERFLGSGRFSTDQAGYTAMQAYAKAWPVRVWAVEGAHGAGPLARCPRWRCRWHRRRCRAGRRQG